VTNPKLWSLGFLRLGWQQNPKLHLRYFSAALGRVFHTLIYTLSDILSRFFPSHFISPLFLSHQTLSVTYSDRLLPWLPPINSIDFPLQFFRERKVSNLIGISSDKMTTMNPFDLLDGVDHEDTAALLAAAQLKLEKEKEKPKADAAAVAPPLNKLSKQKADMEKNQAGREGAGRDARGRGGGRNDGRSDGRGRGYGRGRGDSRYGGSNNNEAGFGNSNGYVYKPSEEGGESGRQSERRGNFDRPRAAYRGGGGGGRRGEEAGEGGDRPRRVYDRHSGSGRGNDIKRDGSGSGNWGNPTEVAPDTVEPNAENEANAAFEKKPKEEDAEDANKEGAKDEEKEAEDKQEMTLAEWEKIRAEQGKTSVVLKTTEQRKVDAKEFATMQQISSKKENDEIFAKLGSDKDKKKEAAEKEEKARKAVSINEFLKPAEGESYRGGRGRGGRGGRGSGRGAGFGGGGGYNRDVSAPKIEDPGQFPSLGGK
ncbi:RGG repeats nuclear RNA binding protein B, partial [Linum grandiflorum]